MERSLWICLNLWMEEFLLPDCLRSIRSNNPEAKIVAVDGVYQSLVNEVKKLQAWKIEHDEPLIAEQLEKFTCNASTDATLEILKEFDVDVIIPAGDQPWQNECVKRSQYFVGKPGDYYFVIDADERLEGRLDWENLTDNGYNVWLQRDEKINPYEILRIFKHNDGMQYRGAHHAMWINNVLYKKENCKTAQGCRLLHRSVHRMTHDPIRHIAKGAYYQYLTGKEEAPFRHQYGL
jgi:hypothetical protein